MDKIADAWKPTRYDIGRGTDESFTCKSLRKIMLIRKLLLPILVLGTFANAAYAADRYVRAGANGNGSDWTNAYPSLPATLVRGDTYYIADGAYSGRAFSTPASGAALITIKKATVSNHGTSAGWDNSYGDGQASFSSQFVFTTPYWVIDGVTGGGVENKWVGPFGFKITDTGAPILRMDSGAVHHVTIRHIDIVGKGSPTIGSDSQSNFGLAAYTGASDITLSHFRMTGIGNCPFFLNARNFIAEHGWVVSYFGDASAHSEIASIWGGSVGDTTFRYNLFTDIQSTGGIMWDNTENPSAKLNIYGNVFYKPAGANWQKANGVIGGWTTSASLFGNTAVYNNAFINVDQQSLSTFPQRYSGNVAYNNIFYNSQSPDFGKFDTHNYNHFINAGGTHSEANGTSAASGDPFVNYVGLDFRLKAATANGLALSPPFNTDPHGAVRGADGVWDRGAFEYSAGAPPTTTSSTVPSTTSTTARATTTTTTTSTTLSVPPSTGGQSVFSTQVPQTLSNSDGAGVNYELGLRFTPTTAGQIRSIRFYKSSSESGSHTGKIYAANGQLLASVVFANESVSGWQVQNLATPLAVVANTEYTVSVNTGNTYYVATNNGLSSGITSGSLQSPAGGGVYGPLGSKPNLTWQNSNYFRDVVFVPNPTGQSLFTTQTPQLLSNTDGPNANYELGMRFTTTTAGQIKAIRFYKSSSESGVHSGKIYAASGQLLALVNFTSETGSGWQVQNLPAPLNIAANTEYTVTVNTGNSYYVATNNGLATQITNGSLHSVGGGVFGPVGAKPTQTWQSSNYFRDVVFAPN
jgi:hypothetical protein